MSLLGTQDLETGNSYQDGMTLLMILPLLDINQIRLYSDTEHVAVINVEGVVIGSMGEVLDEGQEHSPSWVGTSVQHIKDTLRQVFFNEYEGSWATL